MKFSAAKSVSALLALFLGWVQPVTAVKAQPVPAIVQTSVDGLTRECRNAGGGPRAGAQPLTSVDLNGDGILDWVLDAGDLDCDNGTFFCGTGGCLTLIFVSHGAGHTLVWEDNIHGWRATAIRGRPGIHFDLHGSACDRSGAEPCSQRYLFQDGRLVRAQ